MSIYENKLKEIIKSNRFILDIMSINATFGPKNSWLSGGTLRTLVWDNLHNYEFIKDNFTDIDICYFDSRNIDPIVDWGYDYRLKYYLNCKWQCRNQARMHYVNGTDPYTDLIDAMHKWSETASQVCARLINGNLEVIYSEVGINDLFNLKLRPYSNHIDLEKFKERVKNKKWLEKYPKLKLEI